MDSSPSVRIYAGAQASGVFLGFPGQRSDPTWSSANESFFPNVHRWINPETGRFLSEDPWQGNLSRWVYIYAEQNPVVLTDELGLFTIDPNCSSLDCALAQLEREAKFACSESYKRITDSGLRSCVAKKCRTMTIDCEGPLCSELGAGAYTFPRGKKVYLCQGNWGAWSAGPPPGWLDIVIVHEIAHLCGWKHGGGKGVSGVGPDGET